MLFDDFSTLWTGGGDWEPYKPPSRPKQPKPPKKPKEPKKTKNRRAATQPRQLVVGLVAGRFDPPHAGHQLVIDFARRGSDKLYVAVASGPDDRLDIGLRVHWLRESFPFATIIPVHGIGTRRVATVVRDTLPQLPDRVFSSEIEGNDLAEALGAAHVLVDPARSSVPISASVLYTQPRKYERFLLPAVRPFVVRRVCLAGTGGAGKTTLARTLAEEYRTAWVPEYARTLLESGHGLALKDSIAVAENQCHSEDAAATAASSVLFCDTSPDQIAAWSSCMFGTVPEGFEEQFCGPRYDLHLLVEPQPNHGPKELHQQIAARLPEPVTRLSGSQEERLARARAAIDDMLAAGHFLSAWGLAQAGRHRLR